MIRIFLFPVIILFAFSISGLAEIQKTTLKNYKELTIRVGKILEGLEKQQLKYPEPDYASYFKDEEPFGMCGDPGGDGTDCSDPKCKVHKKPQSIKPKVVPGKPMSKEQCNDIDDFIDQSGGIWLGKELEIKLYNIQKACRPMIILGPGPINGDGPVRN